MASRFRSACTLWIVIEVLVLASFVGAEVTAVNSLNRTHVFYDIELNFINDIEGVIVLANPEDACLTISGPPPELLKSSLNCFVLIEGNVDKCGFYDKIKHAVEANYSAAVIFYPGKNIIESVLENKMMVSLWSSNITSILIGPNSGSTIKTNYLYTIDPGSRVFIHANAPNVLTMIVIFAIIAGAFILLMFLFMIIKCIQQYREQNRHRISIRHLKQLPTEKYRSDGPYETCAICLEDYKEKDNLRILPCSHAYHCKCIDPWLTNNRRTCPVCKQRVRLSGVHDDNDSASDTESRAETAPLIRGPQRQVSHGTFVDRIPVPAPSASSILTFSSGEETSRDAPSEALDEISEELNSRGARPCSSAPNVLIRAPEIYAIGESSQSRYANTEPVRIGIAPEASDNDSNTGNSQKSSTSSNEKTVLIV